jgi:hypothetical protein
MSQQLHLRSVRAPEPSDLFVSYCRENKQVVDVYWLLCPAAQPARLSTI